MTKADILKTVANVHNMIYGMCVSGENAITAGDCIRALRYLGDVLQKDIEAEAAADRPDMVTLGEMFNCPYETARFPVYAEQEGGRTWRSLSRLAAGHRQKKERIKGIWHSKTTRTRGKRTTPALWCWFPALSSLPSS